MGTGNCQPERLRTALDTMLHGGEPRTQVRDDIWTRGRATHDEAEGEMSHSRPIVTDLSSVRFRTASRSIQ